jgi:hypothetical protein
MKCFAAHYVNGGIKWKHFSHDRQASLLIDPETASVLLDFLATF